ncbi:MAG: hypothetical protein QOI74_2582 [Micromonosporaceae bacterium]|jgi:hypothetical protein|nr:hypothetical protein [Micromonosporaceae bacterium]MDT5036906.1 hypothetical protein [Micromonosporaceae bacterium]
MRITKLAVVVAGLALGLTACSSPSPPGAPQPGASGGASGPAASTGPGPAGSPTARVANPCVVGRWKSTGATFVFGTGAAGGSAGGGGGLSLTIARDGAVTIDFASMTPVAFSAVVNGAEVRGSFTYGGTAAGVVGVDGSGATGTWQPVGATDWHTMTVTVDLVSPVRSRLVDHLKIADFATADGGATGGSVDLQPIMRDASYECDATTLTLRPPAGTAAGGTWSFTRG